MCQISEKISAKRSIKDNTMKMYLHEIHQLSLLLTNAKYTTPEFLCSCDDDQAENELLDALNLDASTCSDCTKKEFCECHSDTYYKQMEKSYIHTTALKATVSGVCDTIAEHTPNISCQKKKLNSILVLLNSEGIGNPRKGPYKPHPWVDGSNQELSLIHI